jgi:hypothetical protein
MRGAGLSRSKRRPPERSLAITPPRRKIGAPQTLASDGPEATGAAITKSVAEA